ncbi:MAG: hypothetical protein ABEI77_08000 [Halorientalis sp.]
MAETGLQSDKGLGLGFVFGIVAVIGALVMFTAAGAGNHLTAGWGFALAMLGGGIAVAMIHIFS